MTMRQYGLYSKVRERGHKWGFIYFDGDDIAACFQKTSRDAVYDDCNALLKSEWFEAKSVGKRKKNGTYEARKIIALTHKDWCGKHPNQCPKCHQPVAPQQLDENLSSRSTATDQSLGSNQPVAPQQLTSRSGATKTSFKADSFKADSFRAGLDARPEKTDGSRSSPAPAGESVWEEPIDVSPEEAERLLAGGRK
jgi:hypothetical protein